MPWYWSGRDVGCGGWQTWWPTSAGRAGLCLSLHKSSTPPPSIGSDTTLVTAPLSPRGGRVGSRTKAWKAGNATSDSAWFHRLVWPLANQGHPFATRRTRNEQAGVSRWHCTVGMHLALNLWLVSRWRVRFDCRQQHQPRSEQTARPKKDLKPGRDGRRESGCSQRRDLPAGS